MSWTINAAKPSKNTFAPRKQQSNLSTQMISESTQLNNQYKHGKSIGLQFIEQGQDTLNLLRVSRVNPKLSAYAILDGQFNFDKTPLAPVGTRSLILLDPNTCRTWQSHALNAWYLGPAKNQFRNYRFFLPSTKGYRISGSAKFFPKHTKMPSSNPVILCA
eukprot:CCRYP_014473-RA/>CCRYP_014473-RA protein AED:0.49 eAED:0.63 QI:0/0/0/1/0/0/2/0/160